MALQKTHLKTINTIRLHKRRLYKQKNSFKYETKKNSTELLNYVWNKKKDKQEISFTWYIKEKAKAYSLVTKSLKGKSQRKVPYFISYGESVEQTKRNSFKM